MPFEIIFDVILAGLLIAVIAAAYILNGRLEKLRRGQEEMAGLVNRLDQVTTAAQMSVDELKALGASTQRELNAAIAKARGVGDELSLITEAGDNLAGRLEAKLSSAAADARNMKTSSDILGSAADDIYQNDEHAPVRDALKQAR